MRPHARKPLVAANASANARKKPTAASKQSRRRLQVVLTHATEEKENLPHVSSDSDDEIDGRLVHAHSAQKNPSKEQEQEQKQKRWSTIIEALPDPFVLTSSDKCDDPLGGGQSETKRLTAGEPAKVNGVTTTDSDPVPVTTAETIDIGVKSRFEECEQQVGAINANGRFVQCMQTAGCNVCEHRCEHR